MSTAFEKNRRGPALPNDLPTAIAEIKYLQGALRAANDIRMKLFTLRELEKREVERLNLVTKQMQDKIDALRADPTAADPVVVGNSDDIVATCQNWLVWLGYADAAAELTALKGKGALEDTKWFLEDNGTWEE